MRRVVEYSEGSTAIERWVCRTGWVVAKDGTADEVAFGRKTSEAELQR